MCSDLAAKNAQKENGSTPTKIR